MGGYTSIAVFFRSTSNTVVLYLSILIEWKYCLIRSLLLFIIERISVENPAYLIELPVIGDAYQ